MKVKSKEAVWRKSLLPNAWNEREPQQLQRKLSNQGRWGYHGLAVVVAARPSSLGHFTIFFDSQCHKINIYSHGLAYKLKICNHFRNKQNQSVKVEIAIKNI